MTIDSSKRQRATLRKQAELCRRLSEATYDRATWKALGDMAEGLERSAAERRVDNDR